MYLAKELTTLSSSRIARATGDRDHTTALHAFRKIEELIQTDADLASEVATIRRRFNETADLSDDA
jgi:chromosomal replication initiator protein